MTLDIFEELIRQECRKSYADLKDGRREDKFTKKKKTNSMIDVVFLNRKNPCRFQQSCTITFGNVLEKTAMDYAEKMNAKIFRNKNLLASNIDILFQLDKSIYHLESKVNIELDNDKTRKALESLKRKSTVIFNALRCHEEGWQLTSKFVVWTKEDAIEASLTAKHPLVVKNLMGFKDFFLLFGVDVTKEDFFKMLQGVWIEEVEAYIK